MCCFAFPYVLVLSAATDSTRMQMSRLLLNALLNSIPEWGGSCKSNRFPADSRRSSYHPVPYLTHILTKRKSLSTYLDFNAVNFLFRFSSLLTCVIPLIVYFAYSFYLYNNELTWQDTFVDFILDLRMIGFISTSIVRDSNCWKKGRGGWA